ncbi:MAG: lipocalin family protein [Microscillaceae bacterium]|nr:lipocalin family protein [Microscillaceae bacterium]MDW8461966.1 lipocalin family protein [Cytophagales bacterium]
MKKLVNLFALLAIVMFAISCKKEKEPTPQEKIIGKWRITAQNTIMSGQTFPAASCELDNTVEFKSGGTLIFDEGRTKCDASSPQTEQGTWALTGDARTLIITLPSIGNIGISYQVLELTKTRIRVRAENIMNSGATIETTFEKI